MRHRFWVVVIIGWLTGWSNRWPLTVNPALVGVTANVSNAIAKLGLPAALKSICQAAGQDVRFTLADGTTLLDYGIEDWSAAEPVVHAREPDCDEAAHIIYAYGGNAGASDAQNKAGVATDYAGYWPLGDAGPTTAYDWTANANHGTQSGGVTFGAAGKVDGACSFDGLNDHISFPNWGQGSGRTISMWLTNSAPADGQLYALYACYSNGDNPEIKSFWMQHSTLGGIVFFNYYANGAYQFGLYAPVIDGDLHHISLTWGANDARMYVDGIETSSDQSVITTTASSIENTLGWYSRQGNRWTGTIDMFQVQPNTLSADAIAFMAKSFPGSSMFSWGAMESPPVSAAAYYRQLRRRV